jgi:hypothetical protein
LSVLRISPGPKVASQTIALEVELPALGPGQLRVTVANGEHVWCPGVYRDVLFSIDQESFTGDFFALPLAGYDVVLGT